MLIEVNIKMMPKKLFYLKYLTLSDLNYKIFVWSFLKYVEPNEYGIKQVKIGVNRGIHEEIYGPGLHFILPVMQKKPDFLRKFCELNHLDILFHPLE